jgi:hypothetical protein
MKPVTFLAGHMIINSLGITISLTEKSVGNRTN